MHRKKLISLLDQYQEQYPEELDMISRYRDFVNTYDTCFDRDLTVGHVTGSAWVVNETGDKVLLTHHRKLNRWLQLGGHADGETDVLQVAGREVSEESGLESFEAVSQLIFDLDVHLIPERKSVPAHYHYDVRFAFRNTGSDDYIISDESHDLAWVEITNLSAFSTEESILRMAEKWLHITK